MNPATRMLCEETIRAVKMVIAACEKWVKSQGEHRDAA